MNQKDRATLNVIQDRTSYLVVREIQNLQVGDFADKVSEVIELVQSVVA